MKIKLFPSLFSLNSIVIQKEFETIGNFIYFAFTVFHTVCKLTVILWKRQCLVAAYPNSELGEAVTWYCVCQRTWEISQIQSFLCLWYLFPSGVIWFLILHSATVSQWLSLYFRLFFYVYFFFWGYLLFCFFFIFKKSVCISCLKKVLNFIHFLLYPKASYDRLWNIFSHLLFKVVSYSWFYL